MEKIFLALLILPIGVFSQKNFPIGVIVQPLSMDTLKLTISDSTDAIDISDPDPGKRRSLLSLWVVGDSVVKAELDQHVFGDVSSVENGCLPRNISLELHRDKSNFTLFLYYETIIFGPKLYVLNGYFAVLDPDINSGFVPENLNIIQNEEREFCYYYGEKNSWCVASAVRDGRKTGPTLYEDWGRIGDLNHLKRKEQSFPK